MTYKLALSYLASLDESRIKPGLERIREALSALGSPHRSFPHVLVGGTNGKGSVVAFMGTALSVAGFRTGLFTSPHLSRFEERIAVGSRNLAGDDLPGLVRDVKKTGVPMTYFEFTTAMALLHFARQEVDLAVLEVGVGGAWDATNATDPILSIITSVDLDHRQWLGETVEEVAAEKAGILRGQRPLVVGPMGPAAQRVLLMEADAAGAEVLLFGRDFNGCREAAADTMRYTGPSWNVSGFVPGLRGEFQIENAACALAGLETLSARGFRITPEQATRGVRSTRWAGRLEVFDGLPRIIVDAAHNPAGIRALTASLLTCDNVVWLFSALADKDLGGMTMEMVRISNRFVLVPLDHPRGRSVADMESQMPDGAEIRKVSSVQQGLLEARRLAGPSGCVVTAGSVFLAGAVLQELERTRDAAK